MYEACFYDLNQILVLQLGWLITETEICLNVRRFMVQAKVNYVEQIIGCFSRPFSSDKVSDPDWLPSNKWLSYARASSVREA